MHFYRLIVRDLCTSLISPLQDLVLKVLRVLSIPIRKKMSHFNFEAKNYNLSIFKEVTLKFAAFCFCFDLPKFALFNS